MAGRPDPSIDIFKVIKELQRDVANLKAASSFFGTGVRPNGVGGLDSDTYAPGVEGFRLQGNGNVELNGDLDVNGSSRVDGPMTVNGDLDVTGSFTLPDNSIDNSWLANLTGWRAISTDSATGWATSTSMATKASTTVTVPTGYDTALVIAWGLVTFQDSAPNRFDCRCVIEGTAGPTLINLADLVNQTTVLQSRSLAVTSGQVLDLSVQVLSAASTGGAAANTAICGGFALFAR
ncbi:hypothetical protein G7075_04280 [Phycicoccus sp. HDW14]|uniref:hypothetical protein n=1 Tax=Phycicoccus sp. HDW14 TaxID=2714941 RepID=UPI00140B7096|nr:hypothetical protein [Phycicoccus sp. HDW14]QIM20535.1 hypothetical protein G7075_04280 [Phycicoccus sp. HDW14]